MITLLEYLVVAAAIGVVVFVIAVLVFGRGEQMAPLSPRTSPVELPDAGITGADVRRLRFSLALRGYRMSDVDWALERMAEEMDRLRSAAGRPDGGGAEPEVPISMFGPAARPADTGEATGIGSEPADVVDMGAEDR